MKIIETAMIAPSPEMVTRVLQHLPVTASQIWEIPVYRFEADSDLVILFYDLVNAPKLSQEIIDHLKLHIDAVLIVTDALVTAEETQTSMRMTYFCEQLSEKPTTVAILNDPERLHLLSNTARESGFLLSKADRMVFWHPDVTSSAELIWQCLWQCLYPAKDVNKPAAPDLLSIEDNSA